MNRKLTKPQLITCILLGSAVFGSALFMIEFSPISLDITLNVDLILDLDLNQIEIDIDDFQLKNWWQKRKNIKEVIFEYQKLIAYCLGFLKQKITG